MATGQHEKERELQREVARAVTRALPGVEVLALELTGKDRFCVFVDHPQGVDHALCARVTERAPLLPRRVHRRDLVAGLDRPLRTRDHFERAVGRTVRVKTTTSNAHRGEVVSAGERAVQIMNGSGAARRWTYRTRTSCGPI